MSAIRGTTIPNNAANDATVSKPNAWTGPLPLLYHDPQFINLERHRHAGLREIGDYGFTRETNSVPLGADEIFLIQAYCPVVFTASDPALPVAVLGIGNNNSFLDSEGKWRVGVPIPAYIRRYPFIAATDPTAKRIVLAVDEASSAFAMEGGRPLFENDAPSEFAKLALKFCADFQAQLDLSRMIGEAVESARLLASRRVDVRSADGKAMSLDGFRVIDEARFNALPDKTFLTWRKNNWLGVIYAHFLSMRRWEVFAGFPNQT